MSVGKKLVHEDAAGASLSMEKEVKVDGEQDPPQLAGAGEGSAAAGRRIRRPRSSSSDRTARRSRTSGSWSRWTTGREVSGKTDKDGKAELELKSGGKVVFPDLGEAKAG